MRPNPFSIIRWAASARNGRAAVLPAVADSNSSTLSIAVNTMAHQSPPLETGDRTSIAAQQIVTSFKGSGGSSHGRFAVWRPPNDNRRGYCGSFPSEPIARGRGRRLRSLAKFSSVFWRDSGAPLRGERRLMRLALAAAVLRNDARAVRAAGSVIVRDNFGVRREVTAAGGNDDMFPPHPQALGGSFAEVEVGAAGGFCPDPARKCVRHRSSMP